MVGTSRMWNASTRLGWEAPQAELDEKWAVRDGGVNASGWCEILGLELCEALRALLSRTPPDLGWLDQPLAMRAEDEAVIADEQQAAPPGVNARLLPSPARRGGMRGA